jgi:PKD repeat protein
VDPGTYTVSLTASNVVGSDDETKTNYITVQQPPDTAYFEIAPVRFLDSRNGIGLGGTFKPNVPRTLSIAGANGIPGDAVAITGNLTVTDQTRSGYLSITPDAVANPETSALNFPLGDTRANGVTVPLNSGGDLSIVYKNGLTTGSTHVLLDVTGYFRVSTGGSTYHAVAPVRVLDSRSGKGLSGTFKPSVPRQLTVGGTPGIPANAVAITANLTVTDQTRRGFLSITPIANANPNTSSLNFPLGDIRANGVTVPLTGSPGTLWIVYKNGLTTGSTHVLLDVTGYFTAGTGGATFVPVTPARILDTRSGNGLAGTFKAAVPRTWQAWTRGGIATNADAVVGNVTVVGQTRRGYVAITPTPVVTPNTSTINFPVGDIRANNLTVQLSGTGSMSGVYNTGAGGSTHVLFDVFGYYK